MGRTFRKTKRRKQRDDEWDGQKPKAAKDHKAERTKVKRALRMGEDLDELE